MASRFVGAMGGHARTVPQDQDPIGDGEQVLQLLAAEHDRHALLPPRLDERQEPLLVAIGELLGGFVHDDEPRRSAHGLGDGQELALLAREVGRPLAQ